MAIPDSTPSIRGPTASTRLALLTTAAIGLQFCWGTEMTYASPYLLSLGLSKSRLSLVWVAGPLSGLVMQPVIGVVSDRCTSKYGRRRPFMMAGAVMCAVCLGLLGWTAEVVGMGLGEGELKRKVTVMVAVVDIYVLDFVINISQSTCRALVVDTLPIDQQQLGSAWVSRMSGVGNMLMYALGSLDLDALLGNFLGSTQFKKVCVIAAIAMLAAQGTTCWAVTERVFVADSQTIPQTTTANLTSILNQIYTTTLTIPPRIKAICHIQFFSWIAWFPFLFYGSTWVGELSLRTHHAASSAKETLTDVGRAGSIAYTFFAIISFLSSVILPWFVRSPSTAAGEPEAKRGYTPRPPESLRGLVGWWRRGTEWKPSLVVMWAAGCLMVAACMGSAPWIQSVSAATWVIALSGMPMAIGNWAPGTFLGVEVNRLSEGALPAYRRVSSMEEARELDSATADAVHGAVRTRHVATRTTGELSGIYFGILNIYTTLPQFVGTFISWVVFSILEPGRGLEGEGTGKKEGLSGISVCLFIGALSSVVAAWHCRRLVGGD